MLTLAIDTAKLKSVAFFRDDECESIFSLPDQDLASGLIPVLESFPDYRNLDQIIINRGPGSFTALRVGIIFAKGLSLSLNKPIIPFDHFSVLHHKFLQAKLNVSEIIYCMQGKKDDIYGQKYMVAEERLELPSLYSEADINEWSLASEGHKIFGDKPSFLKDEFIKNYIKQDYSWEDVIESITVNNMQSQSDITPLYIRKTYVGTD